MSRSGLPRAAALLTATFVAALFLAAASDLRADDGDKPKAKDTSKVAKRSAKHLRYQKTYAGALLEARVRNLPVFVSRHKDF